MLVSVYFLLVGLLMCVLQIPALVLTVRPWVNCKFDNRCHGLTVTVTVKFEILRLQLTFNRKIITQNKTRKRQKNKLGTIDNTK